MLSTTRKALLLVAGVIHLLPAVGVLGRAKLEALYGVELSDPSLLILVQHRAVLFGLLGAFLVAAIVRPELEAAAILAGLISALSFLAIAVAVGDYNTLLHRVVIADVVAVGCLFGAGATYLVDRHR